jgi:hypothetical protein
MNSKGSRNAVIAAQSWAAFLFAANGKPIETREEMRAINAKKPLFNFSGGVCKSLSNIIVRQQPFSEVK